VQRSQAFAGFIACTLAWGTIGVLVNGIETPSPVIALFRLLFGCVVVLAWVVASRRARIRAPGASSVPLIASGLVLAAHWALQFEAFKRLEVAAAILIVFIGPVLMTALAPLVLRERLETRSIVALAMALCGIALITVPDLGAIDAAGVLAAIGSALLFAVLVLLGKILSARHDAPAIVVWQQGTAAIALLPALFAADAATLARDLPELVVLGIGLTGVLSIVFFRAIRVLKAQQVSVLFYLEPASAVVYAWLVLGQVPSPATLTGGALIVLAGLAIISGERAAAAPAGLPDVVVPAEEGP
jgi:drug/metabolite transporter (DMT)-like permease